MIKTDGDLHDIYDSVVPDEVRDEMNGAIGEMVAEIIRDEMNRLLVSEWAEERRSLPRGLTSMPGPFSFGVTPYLREIADCLSESSPVRKIAIMKGSRVGASVGVAENWIGYVIDQAPGPMMFISGDKESAEAVVATRLDRMIESAGLGHRIFAQTTKSHGKTTGDTKSRKDFAGGFLMALGPSVGAKLRNFGIRYIDFDEVDAYPQEAGDEGDPITLAERRSDEYETTRKILYISTPLIKQTSRIEPLFEYGDRRYFYVPCRHCGHMQVLRWRDPDNGPYRLKFEADEMGRLIPDSVHYECEKCGGHWTNGDKAFFLPRGEWRPTAEAMEPGFRSYHISALYSPVGMRSWGSIAREWIRAKGSPPKLKVFVNTVLGETWIERGEAPSYERLKLRADTYSSGTLPEDAEAVFVTAAADVQADRIEVEVLAFGRDRESWSIEYHVFFGDTANVGGEAWFALAKLREQKFCGLPIAVMLVDCRFNSQVVYQETARLRGVYPCTGDNAVRDTGRTFALRSVDGYSGLQRVHVYSHELKQQLYKALEMGPPNPGEPYPPGYCHFPADYSDRYFQQLTSEEYVKTTSRTGVIKMEWKVTRGRRNEAHDCRIYNMAALMLGMSLVAETKPDRMLEEHFWNYCQNTFGRAETGPRKESQEVEA